MQVEEKFLCRLVWILTVIYCRTIYESRIHTWIRSQGQNDLVEEGERSRGGRNERSRCNLEVVELLEKAL